MSVVEFRAVCRREFWAWFCLRQMYVRSGWKIVRRIDPRKEARIYMRRWARYYAFAHGWELSGDVG